MGKNALIIGLALVVIGGIGAYLQFGKVFGPNYNGTIATICIFAFIFGCIILGAHFKAWLERATGTRF